MTGDCGCNPAVSPYLSHVNDSSTTCVSCCFISQEHENNPVLLVGFWIIFKPITVWTSERWSGVSYVFLICRICTALLINMMELSLTYLDIRCALGSWINYYNLHHFACSQIRVLWFHNSVYLCDGLITRPEESYRIVHVYNWVRSRNLKKRRLDPILALFPLKKEACNLYLLKDLRQCLSPASVFQPNTKISVSTYVSRYCSAVEAIQHANS
jgi:hypothetical protein